MIFRKDIERSCLYCKRGCRVGDAEILCEKKGLIPDPNGACRHFRYDPLKRCPPRPAVLRTEGMCEEDFRL